jgi:hypothetical protein
MCLTYKLNYKNNKIQKGFQIFTFYTEQAY